MLKKNYKLKILLFLALIVLVDTAFVSWKFYTNQGIMGANRIWLVLENWLISLTGDVTVSYADIIDVPGIPLVARWIYGASRFLFPLLGISFILIGISNLARVIPDFTGISSKFFSKNIVVIFGYNDQVRDVIRDCKDSKDRLCLIVDKVLGEEQERELFKDKILFRYAESDFFRFGFMRRAKRVLLMHDDSVENMSIFMKLAKEIPTGQSLKAYCESTDPAIERVVEAFFDKYCRKQKGDENRDKERGNIDLELFCYEDVLVKKALKNCPLSLAFEDEKGKVSPALSANDLHILIAGCTTLGQSIFKQLLSYSVFASSSTIIFDLVDEKEEEWVHFLEALTCQHYLQKFEENLYFLGDGNCDGKLYVRIKAIEPGKNHMESDFTSLTTLLGKSYPYSYLALCMENPSDNFKYAEQISLSIYNQKEKLVPAVICSPNVEELADVFTAERAKQKDSLYQFSHVYFLDQESDELQLSDVIDEEENRKVMQYNHKYNQFYNEIAGYTSDKTMEEEWFGMAYFQRRATKYMYLHRICKQLICMRFKQEDWQDKIRGNTDLLSAGNIKDSLWVTKFFQENPEVEELAKIEHRRWCFQRMLDGWAGWDQKGKDTHRRYHDCLVSWDGLGQDPDLNKTKIYDLISYMMQE